MEGKILINFNNEDILKISLTDRLFNSYKKYYESNLANKRFRHSDVLALLADNKMEKSFSKKLLGYSVENREIFSLEFGNGSANVLLWSQMHGDEPTATMAMFDIFNFLSSNDEFDDFKNELKKKLKLIFVPLLNPDGAELIVRQNALGIDLNRDARTLQAPESKILAELVEKYQPDFAFNLHDQDFRWSVGSSNKLAAISLLAPVYDYNKSINPSRLRAIKLVADLRIDFEKYLPGQIARYKDDFEPRSFGDMIAGKNVSTVLIESGRDINDPNKSFYRKINFVMILSAFDKIINGKYNERTEKEYFEIPTNGNFLFDLILRNVSITSNDKKYVADIAINREEVYKTNSRIPDFVSIIMDIGDLSVFYGIEEYDCKGLYLTKVKESANNYDSNLLINSPANFNLSIEGKVVKQVVNGWLCNPGESK